MLLSRPRTSRPWLRLFAGTLWLWSLSATAQDCQVTGTVRDSATGLPLGRATVRLTSADDQTTYSGTTSGSGAFEFQRIHPGEYRIAAEHAHYIGSSNLTLLLSSGENLTGLELSAEPLGSISGTVLDPDGEPVPTAEVKLMAAKWWHGARQWEVVERVEANERGEFRFIEVPRGRYSVYANRPAFGPLAESFAEGPGQPPQRLAGVVYPDAAAPSGGSSIEMAPGRKVAELELKLRLVPVYHARGRVDASTLYGNNFRLPYVMLVELEAGEEAPWNSIASQVAKDGSFDIPGVPAGIYSARELMMRNAPDEGVTVGVKDRDVSGVTPAPSRPVEINGRIRVEADEKVQLQFTALRLERLDANRTALNALVERDGTFTFPDLIPGRYVLAVPNGGPYYIKKLIYDQTAMTDPAIAVNRASRHEMELVLSHADSKVRGSVDWPDSHTTGGSAVLVAEHPTPGNLPVLSAELTQTGTFEFSFVAPGRYRLFATQDFDAGLWENRDFFQAIAESGVEVEVSAHGETQTKAPLLAPAALAQALELASK